MSRMSGSGPSANAPLVNGISGGGASSARVGRSPSSSPQLRSRNVGTRRPPAATGPGPCIRQAPAARSSGGGRAAAAPCQAVAGHGACHAGTTTPPSIAWQVRRQDVPAAPSALGAVGCNFLCTQKALETRVSPFTTRNMKGRFHRRCHHRWGHTEPPGGYR